jgi:hypothetical protein
MKKSKKFSPEDNIPKLGRMEQAIFIVLYEKHPIPMTEKEIITVINERRLMEMSDEEFITYKQNIISAKEN